MTTHDQISTISATRKRRTYSAEFKHRIVQACKEPNTSIASIALQHGINANLVSKWIRQLDGQQPIQLSATSEPAFIALHHFATPHQATTMLPLQITLPDSNTEISLKWEASEMSALAKLLKALAT